MNRSTLSITIAAFVLSTAACASPETIQHETSDPDGRTGHTAQALVSNGFTCNGEKCVCDPDYDGPDPASSCDGMMRVCDLLGPGMLCVPGDWCYCLITKTKTAVEDPPPAKPPIIRTVSAGTTTATLATDP